MLLPYRFWLLYRLSLELGLSTRWSSLEAKIGSVLKGHALEEEEVSKDRVHEK